MAITIKDTYDSKNKLIPDFIRGDRDQIDPCFAAFKRIKEIYARINRNDDLVANLKLIGKASIRVDKLWISVYQFRKMSEFFTDKESNLMIETLKISYFNIDSISDEDIEFINKISPKILEIKGDLWTVENIKALGLINCTNINVELKYEDI